MRFIAPFVLFQNFDRLSRNEPRVFDGPRFEAFKPLAEGGHC